MPTVEEKLAKSLTAETTELLPYLAYLLQDLWELGSSPRDVADMAREHLHLSSDTKLLDLACGKGAVSIHLAAAFGCQVKGIDLMPEFIDVAKEKAKEYRVEHLCEFVVGDINQAVESERDYDIAILGAVGDVLGPPEATIGKLKRVIKRGGHMFIDDGYAREELNAVCLTRGQWLQVIAAADMKLIAEKLVESQELVAVNSEQQTHIANRAGELRILHPDKAELFDGYVASQLAECNQLESDISGVTMLLRTMHAGWE